MPKTNLTQQFVNNGLSCPPGKRSIEYNDTQLPGLYVAVTAKSPGIGTFVQSYNDPGGKRRHVKIARTSDISLKEARSRGKEIRARITLGEDPQAEARAKKLSMTWDAFFEQRYQPHAKQHKRSWKDDLKMNNYRISKVFGHLRLNEISRHAVQKFHGELKDEGLAPATADHHLKLIRHALNLAVEWELLDKNPTTGLKLFNAENRTERLMSDDQLQRLFSALDSDSCRSACLAAKFLLFTGARKGEALHAKWSDIDRETGTWSIEAVNSKSKKRRSVPLNKAALEVLEELNENA